jgi:hypothetical protein
MRRAVTWVGVALLIATILIFIALDLCDRGVAKFFSNRQFFTAIATEALLLVGVYFVIERFLTARQDKRWRRVAEPGLREIRAAAGTLRRAIREHVVDLPERHASTQQVETVRGQIAPLLDAFDRALDANRPTLTASPALTTYSVPAEKVRVDGRLFLTNLSYARGGARSSEWFEEATRAIERTLDEFEEAYSDVPDESGYVHRLRLS